jgi:hypothetical protein
MTRTLIVGDPHAHPRYSNDRFSLLSRWIQSVKPDRVVCMGDLFDFASLCKHATRQEREGLRVIDEVRVGHDAAARMQRGRFEPPLGFCLVEGNHDSRPASLSKDDPSLHGAVAADLYQPLIRAGWQVTPFKETLVCDGISFCHYFAGGVMGRPIGGATGEALARGLLAKRHEDSIVGHDHRFGVATQRRGDRRVITAFNAGCFVHPDYTEGWCKQTEPMWDRGVLLIDATAADGVQAFSWTSMAQMEAL